MLHAEAAWLPSVHHYAGVRACEHLNEYARCSTANTPALACARAIWFALLPLLLLPLVLL